ncbi:MAG TPA: hypothetical protein VGX68_09240 [Thermoanaerobaculia bacterium]|jgi:hypothetical protein|nr:hypothetical protein [Thermoanaerobaculia bacterium]
MTRNALAYGLVLAVGIGCASASPAKEDALTGNWGGPHISLEVTAEGGRVEYDCAHGTIEGPILPDRDGRFEAAGNHFAEHGGPVREGEEEAGQPVRYRGRIAGKALTLTVILARSGDEVGTFTLTRDATPRLMKCL